MFYRKHARVTHQCSGELVTKQSHKAECDIHTILKQYQRTGILTHVSARRGVFEDLPEVEDFQDALRQVAEAQDAFAQLPSAVRDRFSNDPGRFLAALGDPAQRAFLEEVGVFKKAPVAPSPAPE